MGWTWADTAQQLLIRNQGSEQLDLAQVDIGIFNTVAQAGVLADWNDILGEEYLKENFTQSALDVGNVDGKQLALPWSMASITMVYNPEILARAGWDTVPTTMEEFEQCLADVAALGEGIVPYGVSTKDDTCAGDFMPWLWTFGGAIFGEDGSVTINSEAAVECVKWYQDMLAKGYIAMAFALAIERQRTEMPKKNILVVCASGQGSARLLEMRYRREFGDLIDTCSACDVASIGEVDFSNIDYVFTTVPLPCAVQVPVREVTYFLDSSEASHIKQILGGARDAAGFFRELDEELFFTHLSFPTKQAVIDYLCDRVEEKRLVDADFREKIARREAAAATSFGNLVAMPHPIEAVCDETFACIGLLDTPVVWDDRGTKVQAVFLVFFPRKGGVDLRLAKEGPECARLLGDHDGEEESDGDKDAVAPFDLLLVHDGSLVCDEPAAGRPPFLDASSAARSARTV